MNRGLKAPICAFALLWGIALSGQVLPQANQTGAGAGFEISATVQRYQKMAGIMREMSQQMTAMTEEMAKGGTTPEQNKQMALRMNQMSGVMKRMSGLVDRLLSMRDADAQKQMEQMRRQMDQMIKDPEMTPPKK